MNKIQSISLLSLFFMSCLLISSCGEDDSVNAGNETENLVLTGRSKTYPLAEVDGSGVSGNLKLEEYNDESTKVTISLTGTSAGNEHPAHIHLTSDGSISISLTSVDGGTGQSVTEVTQNDAQVTITYAELVALNGYVNVHLSATDLSVVATGGLGGFEEEEEEAGETINYDVANSGATAYLFTGNGLTNSSNPDLTFKRGNTYTFTINTPGHPFLINSTQGTGTGNMYNSGVTNNGATSGTITFVVPTDAPTTLFYNCEFHGSMTGTITITD